jgi:hypothetical protein
MEVDILLFDISVLQVYLYIVTNMGLSEWYPDRYEKAHV